jgi:hypothetical protein
MEEQNTTNNKKSVPSGPNEAQINCYLQIVKGQTDMSEEEILVSLKEHNYDIVKVVRTYINSGKNTQSTDFADPVNKTTSQSVNQLRFNEIRHFMDKAADSFRRSQEMNRIYQQVMEKKKAQAQAQAAAAANSYEMTNSKL